MTTPSAGVELLVPTVSDVIFKYTWSIKKYGKSINKKDAYDSPTFDYNVCTIQTRWNLSIRYWRDQEGKRLMNPVVFCLNLRSVKMEEPEQTRIRFQFAIYNTEIKQWEMCEMSRIVLNLQTTNDVMSVGYRELQILERHLSRPSGDVAFFVKIQLIQTDKDRNSLCQDMGRLLNNESLSDVVVTCDDGKEFPAHKCVLCMRSTVLAAMIHRLDENAKLDFDGINGEVCQEVLRYIYTDHVENLDSLASVLLAPAERFGLPGLKLLCERSLIETITPGSVASLLLLADQFQCDSLKRSALEYCEDNATNIKKSLAWKVMEAVNPDLFTEACEAGLGSSISSELDSCPSDTDLLGS